MEVSETYLKVLTVIAGECLVEVDEALQDYDEALATVKSWADEFEKQRKETTMRLWMDDIKSSGQQLPYNEDKYLAEPLSAFIDKKLKEIKEQNFSVITITIGNHVQKYYSRKDAIIQFKETLLTSPDERVQKMALHVVRSLESYETDIKYSY